MKIYLIAFLFVSISASAVQKSKFEENCTLAYRNATLNLIEKIQDFKEGRITMRDLGISSGGSKVYLGSLHYACQSAASPTAVDCMTKYKNIYEPLAQKINSLAAIAGNQQDVDSGFFNTLSIRLKIGYVDLSCYEKEE